jgi:hypothetical protein
MGSFMTGYSINDFSEMNDLFTANGYPSLDDGSFSLGGGGHFIINNVIIGGEGHGLPGNDASDSHYRISQSSGYGFFNLGYIVFSRSNLLLYPLLGMGGGGTTVTITGLDQKPADFQDILDDPGRESYITSGGFMLNFSLGTDLFLFGDRSEDGTGGFFAGIRLGYLLDPGKEQWYFSDQELTGSPDTGMSGFYFRITLGGGGYSIQ